MYPVGAMWWTTVVMTPDRSRSTALGRCGQMGRRRKEKRRWEPYPFEEDVIALETSPEGVLESEREHDEAGVMDIAVEKVEQLAFPNGNEGRRGYAQRHQSVPEDTAWLYKKGNKGASKVREEKTKQKRKDNEPSFLESRSNLAFASSSNCLKSSSYFIVMV
jgi:hypothetical protein